MYPTHLAHAIMHGMTQLGHFVPVYMAVAAVQTVVIGLRAELVRRRGRRDLAVLKALLPTAGRDEQTRVTAVLQDWLGARDPD